MNCVTFFLLLPILTVVSETTFYGHKEDLQNIWCSGNAVNATIYNIEDLAIIWQSGEENVWLVSNFNKTNSAYKKETKLVGSSPIFKDKSFKHGIRVNKISEKVKYDCRLLTRAIGQQGYNEIFRSSIESTVDSDKKVTLVQSGSKTVTLTCTAESLPSSNVSSSSILRIYRDFEEVNNCTSETCAYSFDATILDAGARWTCSSSSSEDDVYSSNSIMVTTLGITKHFPEYLVEPGLRVSVECQVSQTNVDSTILWWFNNNERLTCSDLTRCSMVQNFTNVVGYNITISTLAFYARSKDNGTFTCTVKGNSELEAKSSLRVIADLFAPKKSEESDDAVLFGLGLYPLIATAVAILVGLIALIVLVCFICCDCRHRKQHKLEMMMEQDSRRNSLHELMYNMLHLKHKSKEEKEEERERSRQKAERKKEAKRRAADRKKEAQRKKKEAERKKKEIIKSKKDGKNKANVKFDPKQKKGMVINLAVKLPDDHHDDSSDSSPDSVLRDRRLSNVSYMSRMSDVSNVTNATKESCTSVIPESKESMKMSKDSLNIPKVVVQPAQPSANNEQL